MTDGFADIARRAEGRVGQTLKGKWMLDRLLGVGGMAAVYAATHRNRKRAAVKVLHSELSMNTSVRERFLREGYAANSVGHPGAVAVDDDDVAEDGCAFLVMELLEGETLEARWERKQKQLPPDEVLSLVDQVLGTLSAAHDKGIVHRDLKPENLFLTRSGVVKVLDFGIARLRELGSTASKTQTGSTMGTPAFMPPEQARGRWEEVDGRSDVWALGATMFTLLTGRYVHEAETTNEALVQAVTARARSVADLRPDLPFPIVELVDRALAYDKAERWSSATTMQTALRRAYAGLQTSSESVEEALARPITVDTFEDQKGVAPPRIDSEIPAASAPLPKGPNLTTGRGVAHSGARAFGSRTVTTYALGGGVVLLAAAVGTWMALQNDAPAPEHVDAGTPVAVEAESAPAKPSPEPSMEGGEHSEPPAVTLDELPAEASPAPAHSVRVPAPAACVSAPVSAPPNPARKSLPAVALPADPFASRR